MCMITAELSNRFHCTKYQAAIGTCENAERCPLLHPCHFPNQCVSDMGSSYYGHHPQGTALCNAVRFRLVSVSSGQP